MTKRRKSIKRRIANIVFYLLILLFILFGLLVAATDTQVGFRTALHLASPVIKTLGLSITGPVNGTLYDFHLAGLTIQRDGRIIHLNHVALKWNPKRLIHRHLMVKSVSADVQWPIEEPPHVIKPTSKAITTAQAINIPVLNFEVDINQLHLQLMKSSSKKLLDLNGSLDLHQGKLSIKHLKLTGSGLQTTLTGFIDQFTHSQIALVGHWAYAHKHMSLAGQLNIQGNFDDYKINFTANQRHNVLPMNLHISALGNLSGLKSQTFTFKRENGTATGHFNLQFIPLKWSVALTGKSIDWKEEIEANDPLLNFNLKASGDEQKQQLTGQASVNKNKALFDATRTANGDIELKHLTLDSEAGIWRVDPTTFYKDADGFHIPNTCIRQKTNHVCLEASLAGKALKGELLVHLLDISPFADFTPDVSEMTGALSGKMALSGTSSRPIFKGNVALKNGDFSLPGLGLDLKNAKANFSTKGNSTVYVQAQTNSGPGLLKTGGAITWKGNHLVVALGITGKNVLVANLPEASVLVSPQLAFVLNPKLILLN